MDSPPRPLPLGDTTALFCTIHEHNYRTILNVFSKKTLTFAKIPSLDHEIFHYSVEQGSFVMQGFLGALSDTLLT